MKYFITVILVALLAFLPGCGEKKQEKAKTGGEQVNEGLPEIAPYLTSRPSASDGQGQAVVQPEGPFVVGTQVDFVITFTVGEAGIAPKGFIILQISPWWGWSSPQNYSPNAEGFISVSTSFKDPAIQVKIPDMHRVLVFSREQRIAPGETITFKYSRARVDRYAEAEERFMFFVDADGDGHSACIAAPPTLRTIAGEPVYLAVSAPSQTNPGKRVAISAAPLDTLGNWSTFPAGTFTLSVSRDGTESIVKSLETSGKETLLSYTYSPPGEGIYFFSLKGPGELQGKSNVSFCREGKPSLNLYFGDIHGHSRLSDGTGTPGDYYCYARDVSGLDMAVLTDHADYGMIPFAGKVWERIKEAADNMYSPGHFVTFAAYEWTNWTYGHRNVYFRDGGGPVFPSFAEASETPEKLWKLLSPYKAMTIGHHVGGGPVPVDWSIPPGPQEYLVEICSIHGSSDYYGCEKGIYRPREGHFVRDALLRGYKLGIMASGDTHDGHPGQRTANAAVTGIMGVYAEELTRKSVWEALKKRRVYGTSGPKIILNFRVGDSPMGSEVEWPKSKGPLPIVFRAVCCDEIERIEIIRNGIPVFTETGDKISGVFAILVSEDPEPLEGLSWYYAHVVQKDGNMAWSSPVWVNVRGR